MMYINIGCTCAAQIILSFIFSQMSEPIEVNERHIKEAGNKEVRIERTEQLVYSWIDNSKSDTRLNKTSPSADYQKLSGENTNQNLAINNDAESHNSSNTHQTYNDMKVETNVRTASDINEDQKRLIGMFFAFCEPQAEVFKGN